MPPNVRAFTLAIAVVVATVVAGGCAGAVSDGEEDAGPPMQDVEVQFAAVVGDEPFACSDGDGPRTYSNLGVTSSSASFKDFRFYVSNMQLQNDEGDWVPLTLSTSRWQASDVALLDFEDGTGGCVDVGTTDLNSVVRGALPPGTYVAVSFDVAVPFAQNHLDASSADTPSPLNIMALYWGWQVGHKFARIDFNVADVGGWSVHLGSTGCVSDGSADAPSTECGKPNRATVVLDDFDPASDVIQLDAAAIVANADLTANAGGPPGCQSFAADADDCAEVFAAFGMDFDTGACVDDCDHQTAFGVVR